MSVTQSMVKGRDANVTAPTTIEPMEYLTHVPGRQCEGVCPLCARLGDPPEVWSVEYAKALYEYGASEKLFGEPHRESDRWHDDIFSRAGEVEVFTEPVPLHMRAGSMRHVKAAVCVYETSVWISQSHEHAVVREWCWTEDMARTQHARWLVKAVNGELDHLEPLPPKVMT